jgi:hypothetical protein
LPGVPFIIAIKLLHSHGLFQQLQQTAAYKTAAGAAQHLSRELLVDPRDQALMVVSLSCAASTSGLSLLLVVQHLLRPGQTHLPVVLLRQAVMAGTLVLMFTAKHQESHRRKAIYKHKLAQATLQVRGPQAESAVCCSHQLDAWLLSLCMQWAGCICMKHVPRLT